jgi:muramoyltetrapeptide carboxypeptidase LdcA involved in peptidoglycan recycling
MIKPNKLHKGDRVAIVSLSSGIMGEDSIAHEVKIAERQMVEFGLIPVYMPNSMKRIEYLQHNPEKRAEDLKIAFSDTSIAAIICAIGGDDTFKTIPFLMDDIEFVKSVKEHPKIFLGFSDTTTNHLMLYKLGLQTFYGQAYLTDLGELLNEMLPYTKTCFENLFFGKDNYEITSSPIWYDERVDFGIEQIDIPRVEHKETRGFQVLRGSGKVTGKLLGGCVESFYELLLGRRYSNQVEVAQKYGIFPEPSEWKGKVLFIETSEERPSPKKLMLMLNELDKAGVFSNIVAILVGKPQNEVYYEEYKTIFLDATKKFNLPILYNLNFGHAYPHCVLPFGARVCINFDECKVFVGGKYY